MFRIHIALPFAKFREFLPQEYFISNIFFLHFYELKILINIRKLQTIIINFVVHSRLEGEVRAALRLT